MYTVGMDTNQRASTTGPVVGVRTTRIYCRPDCRPGREPLSANCIPFPDSTAARVGWVSRLQEMPAR